MNFPSSLTSNNNNNSRRVMCISPVTVSKIKIQKELCPYNPFVMMVMLYRGEEGCSRNHTHLLNWEKKISQKLGIHMFHSNIVYGYTKDWVYICFEMLTKNIS